MERIDDRLKGTREFSFQLRKSARLMAMYRHSPARFPEYVKPAYSTLVRLLEGGPLSLKVSGEAFLLGNEPVLAAEGGDNVAGRFFLEGVRLLTFRPGVTEGELLKLVTIIVSSAGRNAEPIVSQMFDASLQGIEYVVVEGFTVADMSEAEVQVEVEKIVEYLHSRLRDHTEDTLSFARVTAADLDLKLEGIESIRGVVFDGDEISPAFRKRVQEELNKDETQRAHRQLLETLFATLRGGNLPDVAPMVEALAQVADGLLMQEDFASMAEIVEKLRAIERQVGPNSSAGEIRRALSATLSDSSRILKIAEALKSSPKVDAAAISALLHALDETAMTPLSDALSTLEQAEHRELFTDVISALGRDKPDLFFSQLSTAKPQTDRDIVAVIVKARFPDAAKRLEALLKGAGPQLQADLLPILSTSKDVAATHRLLLGASIDKSPQVRAVAFRVLAEAAPIRAAQDLLRLPKLPDWDKRSAVEKELIYSCMGLTEQAEVLKHVIALLQQKKTLFGGKKIVESKLLAIAALSSMTNMQAGKMLMALSESKDSEPEVAAAARKAVLQLKRTLAENARKRAALAPANASVEPHQDAETKAAAASLFGEFNQAREMHAAHAALDEESAQALRARLAEEEIATQHKEQERLAKLAQRREGRLQPTPRQVPAVAPGPPPPGDDEVDLDFNIDAEDPGGGAGK